MKSLIFGLLLLGSLISTLVDAERDERHYCGSPYVAAEVLNHGATLQNVSFTNWHNMINLFLLLLRLLYSTSSILGLGLDSPVKSLLRSHRCTITWHTAPPSKPTSTWVMSILCWSRHTHMVKMASWPPTTPTSVSR